MVKKEQTAGESMIAFARGEKDHGCIVHIPAEIDVKAIREKMDMSQEEFSRPRQKARSLHSARPRFPDRDCP